VVDEEVDDWGGCGVDDAGDVVDSLRPPFLAGSARNAGAYSSETSRRQLSKGKCQLFFCVFRMLPRVGHEEVEKAAPEEEHGPRNM